MSENSETKALAADIDATRESLIANLDELVTRAQPENIAAKQVEKVKKFYLDEYGGVRVDRAAKTAGVFAALVILRKLFK